MMAAGWLALIQAATIYAERRAEPAVRRFSARLVQMALVLILGGATVMYLAVTIHSFRTPPGDMTALFTAHP